ncbi:hypothetical protein Q8F55_007914 [Vanrija albida]|uniref:Uncharacterized protein n=1 Tax=Vanrija albida TaxID=181172 RepID=A0ABR3PUV7_9TREE
MRLAGLLLAVLTAAASASVQTATTPSGIPPPAAGPDADAAALAAARAHTAALRTAFIAATAAVLALCVLLGAPFAVWLHRAVAREVGGGRGAELPAYAEEPLPKYEAASPRSSSSVPPAAPAASRHAKVVTVAALLFARPAAAQATAAALVAEQNAQALYAMGIVLGVAGPPAVVAFFVLPPGAVCKPERGDV